MPVPTRPVTGGPIESSWGQEAHDGVFTPSGGRWAIPNASTQVGTYTLTAEDDPSDWLGVSTNTLTVPTDGDGLYLVSWRHQMAPASDKSIRLTVRLNGNSTVGAGAFGSAPYFLLADTVALATVCGLLTLTAGDTVTFFGDTQPRTDTDQQARIELVRIGSSFGLA